jgi:tRNA pseudouridine32 synthase/23S rRNA pseudouridine746 synthase
MSNPSKFIPFIQSVADASLPEKFTFPFYYEPHTLSIIAAQELQQYIETQTEWKHNFGLIENQPGIIIGKMFGVLVVKNQQGKLGYLAAFSGKLADSNNHSHFVPPIFDMLQEDGFYRKGERLLYEMSAQIQQLEQSEELLQLKQQVVDTDNFCNEEIFLLKQQIKEAKTERKTKREEVKLLPESEQNTLLEQLQKQSIKEQFYLKDLTKIHREKRTKARDELEKFEEHIRQLKRERKEYSNEIQNRLFDQYHFLNANGKTKNVLQLFEHIENGKPPSGAGECCAPKLLQYAYQHHLTPIAMAEFWWGASPASEIRKHKLFYPSCRGKCEPILGHMLQGLNVDPNPMKENPAEGKELEIIYEDDEILLVNKPSEFLSVPGKTISDSVFTRMETYLPQATGPLLVHRLDMSTSGILLVAKNKDAHAYLQDQFIRRIVKKRYVALLDGELTEKSGIIDLPLRVDLDDRPRQLVCYEHGKTAKTEWELIEVKNGKSKVYFYPLTGRTHQLRVHSAHPKGLNMPITGDDLYGTKADRLHLHAEQLTFKHPTTKEWMTFRTTISF